MTKQRVLIIGATGFVGKNLVLEMASRSHVTIFARPTSDIDLFKHNRNITVCLGDLESGEGLRLALHAVDIVIHCAARTMARSYWDYYRTNALGTANLLEAMRAARVRKILYISSHAACGPGRDNNPVQEHESQKPVSFYGRTKKLAEEMIVRSGLSYTIVRPASVYGPHDKEILAYVRLLNNGICPLVGFGPKYLNLIYVRDLVDLIADIVRRDLFADRIYFAHDGRCYLLESALDTISRALDKKSIKIRIPSSIAMLIGLLNDVLLPSGMKIIPRDKVRELACPYWVCSTERAVEDIGFRPRYTFERGILETIDWYRKHGLLG
ncbi:NAD-dependent epimerase/dehydratase family protein [candidate division WOR-3 bacterium]|nr:NAD-dependent epimerase/dehydratase family protein [candidate division WOR-3 bacterium]